MKNLRGLIAFFAAALFLLLPASAQNTRISFWSVDRNLVQSRLDAVPRQNVDREQLVKTMLEQAGCTPDHISEQVVRHETLPNIICVLPGQTDEVIMVGAHFDHVSAGDGAVDNWTGVSLLPSLFESLNKMPRRHTYMFVAFTGEEEGLVGSTFYVMHLSRADKAKLKAMVNLDTLGLSPTKVWATKADPKLLDALASTAAAFNLPLGEFNVDGAGSSDSAPFRKAGIPSMTIHSVTSETWNVLHSSKDTVSAVNMDDYYGTYRLVAGYLAYLDQALQPTAQVATGSQ